MRLDFAIMEVCILRVFENWVLRKIQHFYLRERKYEDSGENYI
jgi:hypothetical protein